MSRSSAVTARCAALLTCALMLSGCVKIEADLAIDPNAAASGTITVSMKKDAAVGLGVTTAEDFGSLVLDTDAAARADGLIDQGNCALDEDDQNFTMTCIFPNTAFTSPNGLWTVKKTGDIITMHVYNDPTGKDAFGDLVIHATFPGSITSLSGRGATKTSETTADIIQVLADPFDITITSESGDTAVTSTGSIVAWIAGGVMIIIAIGVAIAYVVHRRRQANRSGESTPTGDGAS